MQFYRSSLGRVLFSIPVLMVNLVTFLNLVVLHLTILSKPILNPSDILKSLIIYFCVTTGMIAYFRAFTSDPGSIPLEFDLLNDSTKEKLPEGEYGADRRFVCISFCFKCERDRPARAHHCILCGKCVMRMDHHCPWIGNCVGIHNFKFFLQFIFYAMVTTSILIGTCGEMLLQGDKSFVANAGFLFTLGLFVMLWTLSVYHSWMASINTNTIELTYHRDKSNFDFGWKANLCDLFGPNYLLWPLPVTSNFKQGLGYEFPVKIMNSSGETVYFSDKVLYI